MKDDTEKSTTIKDIQVLLTASEAFPVLERAFLDAEKQITAGFRIFDLSTKLRSKEAREVGEDWFDLIVHTLERGVSLTLILSDFDPILANELHVASWKSRRAFMAVREVAEGRYHLRVINAAHPARVGFLPRSLLWPKAYGRLKKLATDLNHTDRIERDHLFRLMPGVHRGIVQDENGLLRAKKWPLPRLIPATHHQKIAVFDDKHLYIGGLDLDERRYDDKGHHRRQDDTWHDIQLMCGGSVVSQAQKHLDEFLDVIANQRRPSDLREPLVRTLSAQRSFQLPFISPKRVCHTVADTHLKLIKSARKLIYLETQFFRDRKIAKALAQAAKDNPDLDLILIIPAAPEDVAFQDARSADARYGEYLQTRCIDIVTKAFGSRATICSPVRPRQSDSDRRDTLNGSPIIYVHAKVSIFDEEAAIVSSANLNGRSMYWDTEAGVVLNDPEPIGHLRRRCFDHWLGKAQGPDHYALGTAAACWKKTAKLNDKAQANARQGFLVPYKVAPARRMGRMLPGVPDEMV